MSSFLRKANIGVDFRTLAGSFVRDTILPHDLDGIVEVGGRFLILECKQDGEELSVGQTRSLQALAREDNKQVWEVRLSGASATQGAHLFDPVAIRRVRASSLDEWHNTDIEKFKKFCMKWSCR